MRKPLGHSVNNIVDNEYFRLVFMDGISLIRRCQRHYFLSILVNLGIVGIGIER